MWTGEDGGELCQDCWEVECDKSWWETVIALDKLGLIETPPNN